jgi:uncharacterized protein YuzE
VPQQLPAGLPGQTLVASSSVFIESVFDLPVLQAWQVDVLKIEYDRETDAAYISLARAVPAGGVSRTVCVNPQEIGGMVNLDLDHESRIVGLRSSTRASCSAPRWSPMTDTTAGPRDERVRLAA